MARLLIPSLLDDHFPLLQYAFASGQWEPVLLTEDAGLADLGLRYIHSDMCYPAHLVAGQVLAALESGKYDVRTCGVLIGQAGDECRGSCFIRFLRKALDRAGYPEVRLLSLNVRGIDRETGSVAQGKSADLIVCRENPLDNLAALRELSMVIFRGKRIASPKVKTIPQVDQELDNYL